MKKIFLVVFLMGILLVLSVFIVFATVTYTIIEPDDYNETTNTFFMINWTGSSTINKTYEVVLYLNGVANSSYSACANNSYCNISANNLYIGFWQWYLNFTERNSTANVTTVTSKRWLEVREVSNLTFLKWGTPATDVMWLNVYTGDLNISGTFYSAGPIISNNTGILSYIDSQDDLTRSSIINNITSFGVSAFGDINFTTLITGWNANLTTLNVSGQSSLAEVTATTLTATSLFGELPWTNLSTYPNACPSNTYVTAINDTITCTGITNDLDGFNANFTTLNVSGTLLSQIINASQLFQLGNKVIDEISLDNQSLLRIGMADKNCSIDNSCPLITYDSETVTIRDSIPQNITYHENNYKHGNTTQEIRDSLTGANLNLTSLNISGQTLIANGKLTGNLNASGYNISLNCLIFGSGGKICSGS